MMNGTPSMMPTWARLMLQMTTITTPAAAMTGDLGRGEAAPAGPPGRWRRRLGVADSQSHAAAATTTTTSGDPADQRG